MSEVFEEKIYNEDIVDEVSVREVDDIFATNDLPGSVNSIADVNRYLYIIKKLTKERDQIIKDGEEVVKETMAFYEHKRNSKQNTIDFFAGYIEAYVRANANVATLNGKAMVKKVTNKTWASDEELLRYSKEHGIETNIKTTEKPIKKAIEEFIGDGESSVLDKTVSKKFYIK